MNYYGFLYAGKNASYEADETITSFDNPFDALTVANKSWDENPANQIARLLVLVETGKSKDSIASRYAFFQFTNSNSCKKFIDDRTEIIWSTPEDQIWNGNAKMMK